MVGLIIEATVMLVLTYLVLTNATGFSTAFGAASSGYVGAVKALQGR